LDKPGQADWLGRWAGGGWPQLNETERLRAAEARLQESESRAHRLNAALVHLRYSLEEKQAVSGDVAAPLVPAAVPVPAAAAPAPAPSAVASPSATALSADVADKENAAVVTSPVPVSLPAPVPAPSKVVVAALAPAAGPVELVVQRESVNNCQPQ
jgi:hypothetical protein